MNNPTKPYVPKATHDTITSEDWNNIQSFARTALQEHDHSGTGDKARPINTNGMADNAVSTAKLQDRSVTDIKIDSLSADKIIGEIKTRQLADGAVTDAKIHSLSTDKITGDIKAQNLPDGIITQTKVAAGSIATDHLQDKSVTNKKIKKVNANKLTGAIKVSGKTNTIAMNQGIQIGGAPDNAPEGTIRWTGKDFEGKIGNQWVSLTTDSDSMECDLEDSEDSEEASQDIDNEQNTGDEADTKDKPKKAKNKKSSNDN